MYCPVCKSEYREGFHRCSNCNVLLVNELPPKPKSPNRTIFRKTAYKIIDSLKVPFPSIRLSIIVCLFEITVFAIFYLTWKYLYKNMNSKASYIGLAIMASLIINYIILPIVLSIFNLIKNIKAKRYMFLSNIVLIVSTISLIFIIHLVSTELFDKRLITGYDLRQEVTAGMFYILSFQLSLVITIILGLISQIILVILYLSKKRSSHKPKFRSI